MQTLEVSREATGPHECMRRHLFYRYSRCSAICSIRKCFGIFVFDRVIVYFLCIAEIRRE